MFLFLYFYINLFQPYSYNKFYPQLDSLIKFFITISISSLDAK